MLEFIEDAKSKGAEVVFGGQKVKRPGFFLQPTVLANVTNDMACQNEEIFGPILFMCNRFRLLISQFSKNMWGLERYFSPLEFGTNHEFLAQRV